MLGWREFCPGFAGRCTSKLYDRGRSRSKREEKALSDIILQRCWELGDGIFPLLLFSVSSLQIQYGKFYASITLTIEDFS